MSVYVELDVVAAVSVTLAAYTSLLAAVRGGNLHDWEPRPRLGFWLLVAYSLGALWFSLLPGLLRDLGVEPWQGPVIFLAAFHAVGAVTFVGRHLLLTRSGMRSRSNILWLTCSTAMILTFAILVDRKSVV